MTTDEMYDDLNRTQILAGHEGLLKEYLEDQVKRYQEKRGEPRQIAYEIAGLMSASSLVGLPESNPYIEILQMAGQLELPEPHRSADASWEALKALINDAPL